MRFLKAEQAEVEEEEGIEQVNAHLLMSQDKDHPPPPPLMSQEEDHLEDDDYYEDEDREEEVLNSDDEEEDDKEEEEEEKEEEEEEEEHSSSAVIPTLASPYMVVHHGIDETEQTFYSISKGSCCDRSVPEMYGTTCCASSNGWLVMLESFSNRSSRFCFLLNSVSFEEIELPSIKTSYECDYCVLTSSPPDCVVMFLSVSDNSCLFCRPNDKRWTRKILGRKPNPVGSSCFQVLLGAVSCEGKIYINYSHGHGMKILDYKDGDSRFIRNRFSVEKIKFNEELRDSFDNFITDSRKSLYLVESCAELFLVVKIYFGFSNPNIYSFSVYKLMTSSSMGWKKVETLGNDRVFFVSTSCSLSVSASKAGLKENYIYFFHRYDPRYLYRFSMDTGSICKTLSVPDVAPPWKQPYWMISNSIL